ncbi:ferredoxin [Pseudonocardia acaciae]|uniref:ferredoxin n=1 Tax=Pseudonocardia acaciae TaxID=551276 RepID=UPI00048E01F4|nr:ferredoxin [Pseudonocardia acaciae]
MRVHVDPELCQGTGLCVAVAPEEFELAEHGPARPLNPDVDEDRRRAVEEAVQVCPVGALRLSPRR